jgi:geranylgeranyl diphosphate synthase type II
LTSSTSAQQAYNELKKLVNDHILDYMPKIDSKVENLFDAMSYSLTAGGKRIRAIILLAAYDLCEKPIRDALPFACAVEYIHTYSLIHDDLPAMDDDDLRRGKPANHRVFGEAMAILAGDGLLSAAFELMNKYQLMCLDNPEVLKCFVRAQFCIAKGIGVRGMVAGQVADIESENKLCSSEMLDFIHVNKTAAFIRACAKAGGYLGGANPELLSNLEVYGENLGLAFQVVDDILDITSNKEEMGYTTGGDADSRKCTYPAVFGLEESKEKARELLGNARGAIAPYYYNAEVLEYIIRMLEEKID